MSGADKFERVENFMRKVKDDPRVTAAHISLFVALICIAGNSAHPLYVFSHEIKPWCKISGSATYYRCIRELHEFGHINYFPSYNHNKGSRVEFIF